MAATIPNFPLDAAMGRVTVPAVIENLVEALQADQGVFPAANVRRVEVPDALVDTGATGLSLPASLIAKLGLAPGRTRRALTAGGPRDLRMFGAVRLRVQGRDCHLDVTELPDGCPTLIGQVPLELLDFLVDPGRQRLIPNPAHGGEQMQEIWSLF